MPRHRRHPRRPASPRSSRRQPTTRFSNLDTLLDGINLVMPELRFGDDDPGGPENKARLELILADYRQLMDEGIPGDPRRTENSYGPEPLPSPPPGDVTVPATTEERNRREDAMAEMGRYKRLEMFILAAVVVAPPGFFDHNELRRTLFALDSFNSSVTQLEKASRRRKASARGKRIRLTTTEERVDSLAAEFLRDGTRLRDIREALLDGHDPGNADSEESTLEGMTRYSRVLERMVGFLTDRLLQAQTDKIRHAVTSAERLSRLKSLEKTHERVLRRREGDAAAERWLETRKRSAARSAERSRAVIESEKLRLARERDRRRGEFRTDRA